MHTLPPILQRLAGEAEVADRAREDAAAAAAVATLAAFDPSPPALTKARAATEKTRTAVDQLRAKLADAEHALAQAAATEAQLAYELGETHRRLRRAAVAPWRLRAAIGRLQAMADDRFDARQGSDGAVAMAGHRVLVDRLQTLRALADGAADPIDLDAFVVAALADVTAAEDAARHRASPAPSPVDVPRPRFAPPLIRR